MTPELATCIQRTEEQALIHAVVVCGSRDIPTLRAYLALCERDHGHRSGDVAQGIIAKARRLLQQAEEVEDLRAILGRALIEIGARQ